MLSEWTEVVFQPDLASYEEGDPYCIQNPANCTEFVRKPRYRMAYSLSVPDLPGTDLTVAFVVGAAGNLVTEAEIEGLPDCVHDPMECAFTVVDEASMISIARQAGLESGLGQWRTHFGKDFCNG